MGDYFPAWLDELVAEATKLSGEWDDHRAEVVVSKVRSLWPPPAGDPTVVSRGLILIAALPKRRGDLPGYADMLERAVDHVRGLSGVDRDVVVSVAGNLLAGAWEELARYDEAESMRTEFVAAARRLIGSHPRATAICLGSAGLAYSSWGDVTRSEPLLVESVDAARQPEVHEATLAAALEGLAAHYGDTGAARRAEDLYAEALGLWREAGRLDRVADTLIVLASSRRLAGEQSEAAALLAEAADTASALVGSGQQARSPDLLRRIAVARCDLDGDLRAARASLNSALSLSRDERQGDPEVTAAVLGDLGRLDLQEGHVAAASRRWKEELAIHRARSSKSGPGLRSAILRCARVQRASGDPAGAHALAREALRGCSPSDRAGRSKALREVAAAQWCLGLPTKAYESLRLALDLDDAVAGRVLTSRSEQERLGYVRLLRITTGYMLSLALDHPPAVPGAYLTLMRRKGLAALVSGARREALLEGRYPELRETFEALAALNLQIAHLELMSSGRKADSAEHAQRLPDLRSQASGLEERLSRGVPEMDVLASSNGDLARVRGALGADAALVEFVRFGRIRFDSADTPQQIYAAFVLCGNDAGPPALVDLGPATVIDAAIDRLRKAIAYKTFYGPDPVPVQMARLHDELRALLLEPLAPYLGERSRVLFAPDGHLSQLSWACLEREPGRPLIEELTISCLPTGRDLLHVSASAGCTTGPPLVVAAPDFDLTIGATEPEPDHSPGPRSRQSHSARGALTRFMPLPATETEGRAVARLLGVHPVLGAEATKASIVTSTSPRCLHIATHGFALEPAAPPGDEDSSLSVDDFASRGLIENPLLRCGLALAGANTFLGAAQAPPGIGDGILNGEDIAQLDLRGTRVVVLSACDSGLGQVHAGEGVFGLTRAFLMAGAETVISALWPIPDRVTARLMTSLHRSLAAGADPADALTQAQRHIRSTDPNPVNWAGFVCSGRPTSS